MNPNCLPICTYNGRCAWRRIYRTRTNAYPICALILKKPNETCTKLQYMTPYAYIKKCRRQGG